MKKLAPIAVALALELIVACTPIPRVEPPVQRRQVAGYNLTKEQEDRIYMMTAVIVGDARCRYQEDQFLYTGLLHRHQYEPHMPDILKTIDTDSDKQISDSEIDKFEEFVMHEYCD